MLQVCAEEGYPTVSRGGWIQLISLYLQKSPNMKEAKHRNWTNTFLVLLTTDFWQKGLTWTTLSSLTPKKWALCNEMLVQLHTIIKKKINMAMILGYLDDMSSALAFLRAYLVTKVYIFRWFHSLEKRDIQEKENNHFKAENHGQQCSDWYSLFLSHIKAISKLKTLEHYCLMWCACAHDMVNWICCQKINT